MQVPGSDNAGTGSDILWSKFILEGKETLLVKKKANGTILGSTFILSKIFVSECTLTLILVNIYDCLTFVQPNFCPDI